ncbi:MAG: ATP-binding protein [Deltaproteobacteria bacterium]|jgi:two-component system sensor histidine kinase HydH|nr:ATP-binding protein [Deltaproteobacteria bacterium]
MIPRAAQPFKISRIALSLVVASILLALLVLTMTTSGFRREEALMERFFLNEGLTLIRSFEAGARTSMRHYRQGEDPLTTLVKETTKTEAVAYIHIVDEPGALVAGAGEWPQAEERPGVSQVLGQERPLTTLIPSAKVFEIASLFQPLAGFGPRGMMRQRWQRLNNADPQQIFPDEKPGRQVIFIGLRTSEFDQIRHQGVRHGWIMAAILFLVGSAGFYFLFLYQGIRVSRSTQANLELYTENVIKSMPAGLITLDRLGRIVSWNAKAAELAGRSFTPLGHQRLDEVFPHWPPDLLDHDPPLLEAPLECLHEHGERIPVKVSGSRLKDQEGREMGTVLILRDISVIRDKESQVERSRRLAALGQMAAGIAHEIRNPLGTLRGFAHYFKGQCGTDESGREYAELMIGEVDRLNHIISALLQFARPRDPDFQEIDPCVLLAKAAHLLEHDFAAQGQALHLACAEKMTLQADPDLLLQVLINLLKNSMAATPAEGAVELGACREKGGVRIWVQDSGTGMSEEEQEKMFDPFFTTKKSGTGLGLAVSHQIIEQHQGRFEVISAPARGTRIDILLPAERPRGRK